MYTQSTRSFGTLKQIARQKASYSIKHIRPDNYVFFFLKLRKISFKLNFSLPCHIYD